MQIIADLSSDSHYSRCNYRIFRFASLVVVTNLFLALVSFHSLAQSNLQKVRFSRIEANAGLSSSHVICILQDAQNYLWVGTSNGLNKYDGYQFKVYQNQEKDSNSLLHNSVEYLFEDHSKKLWVSTRGGGLHYYNRLKDKFIRVPEFSSDCEIVEIKEDKDHNITVSGARLGKGFIAKLNHLSGRWEYYGHPEIRDYITSFEPASSDEYWIGVLNKGFFKWNVKTKQLIAYQGDIRGRNVFKVLNDKKGFIWVGSENGLSKFAIKSSSFVAFTNNPSSPDFIPTDRIREMTIDNNYLWLATENDGVGRLNTETNNFASYIYNKYEPYSVSDNSIWTVYKDKQERIWVGTFSKGLCVIDRFNLKFPELDISLNNDIVNAIHIDHKNRIWIGTEGGVAIKSRSENKAEKLPFDDGSLNTEPVLSFFEDSYQQMWLGMWHGGVNKYNEKTGVLKKFMPDPKTPNSLSNPNIYSINEDPLTHELLVSTYNGLNVLEDEKKGIFKKYIDTTNDANNYLRCIYTDRKGNVWVGTIDELMKYDRTAKKIIRLSIVNPKDFGMIQNGVNSIAEDKKGRLWVGTNTGLHLFVNQRHYDEFKTEDGLPDNIINSILEDSKGNLWLGTMKGISKFNYEAATFTNFDVNDGLLSNEFKPNACFKSKDGLLFFGGKGVNVFHPDSISFNPHVPNVFITDFKLINNQNQQDSLFWENINKNKEVSLSSTNNYFTINYVGINLSGSNKNQYAYKLDGFNDKWNNVGATRTATFTNLDPGTYTFHVKASNNDGVWNNEGAKLVIHILPPWWKTLWFRVLAVMSIVGISYAYYKNRLNNIKKQNRKLELLVDQRTKELHEALEEINTQNEELSEANDSLVERGEEIFHQRNQLNEQYQALLEATKVIEEQNHEILRHNKSLDEEVKERTKELVDYNQQLEQFAFIAAHNLRAPVARILGLGEVLKLLEMDPEQEKAVIQKLIFTTKELDHVVKDMTTILEIRKDNNLVTTKIKISSQVDKIKENLVNEIEHSGAKIVTDFSAVDELVTVKPYFDSIIYNLISNAIKYSNPEKKPVIKISSSLEGDFITIKVADNGLGIDLGLYKKNLFNLYKRFHFHVEGKGMGLYLVKTQMTAMGGRIEVESALNEGTTFIVYFKR